MSFRIPGVDTDKKVFIVAEAGVNHEGSLEAARALVRAAKESGADAVKFQTYLPEEYIARSETERFARVSRFALSAKDFQTLSRYAKELGILFFSTPLDKASVETLSGHMPLYKISSGDMDFQPLVNLIAAKKKPIIFSTGTATLAEIKRTLGWIRKATSASFIRERVAVLHCVAAYPAQAESVNLATIRTLEKALGVAAVGYSDHTAGIEVAPLAVAAGARIIEKHFTLSRDGKVFRDHFISTEPAEFKEMVRAIRRIEILLGRDGKVISAEELANIPNMRRGIAVKNAIQEGSSVRASDLLFVRPQKDFTYSEAKKVVGRKARNPIAQGSLIRKEDLK